MAFRASPHAGPLGKPFSLLTVSGPAVTVQAIKKAENRAGIGQATVVDGANLTDLKPFHL